MDIVINLLKFINKEKSNRIEFLLINYDFFDGNDLISKILVDNCEYNFISKIDGIWYTTIQLAKNDYYIELVWHEDVGNYIYNIDQSTEGIENLHKDLDYVVKKLNELMIR